MTTGLKTQKSIQNIALRCVLYAFLGFQYSGHLDFALTDLPFLFTTEINKRKYEPLRASDGR